MSASDQMVSVIEETMADGHNVHYSFVVQGITHVKPWLLIQDYQTKCQFLPTTWRFRIMFRQFLKKGGVFCSTSLKRHDSGDNHLKAFMWISFYNADGKPMFAFPKRIYCEGMSSGDEIHGSIGDKFSYGEALAVGITIFIRSCHSDCNQNLITDARSAKS